MESTCLSGREYFCPFGTGSLRHLCASKSEDLEAETGNASSESCDLLYNRTDVYRNNIYIWPVDGFGIIFQLMDGRDLSKRKRRKSRDVSRCGLFLFDVK